MSQGPDWARWRANKWAKGAGPSDWPSTVRPISQAGLSLFGLDDRGRLYWDGEEVVITRRLELSRVQAFLAGSAVLVGILVGLVELTKFGVGIDHLSDLWTSPSAEQQAPDLPR